MKEDGERAARLRLVCRGLVLAAAGLILVACDPEAVPRDRDRAELTIRLNATGGADLHALLGGRTEEELRSMGGDLAPGVFPSAASTSVDIDENGPGAPFLVVHAVGLYVPGNSPTYRFSGATVREALVAKGITDIDLTLCPPKVSVQIEGSPPVRRTGDCLSWALGPEGPDPQANLVMFPDPRRWWVAMGLLLISLVGVVAQAAIPRRGVRGSRANRTGVLAGAAGVSAMVVGVVIAVGVAGENLGVAGRASGFALSVATVLPILVLPFGIASGVLLVMLWGRNGSPRVGV